VSVKHPHPPSLALMCLSSASFAFLALFHILHPNFLSLLLFFSSSPFLKILLIHVMCFLRLPIHYDFISFCQFSHQEFVWSFQCLINMTSSTWAGTHTHTQSSRWLKIGRGVASDEEQHDVASLSHVIRGDHLRNPCWIMIVQLLKMELFTPDGWVEENDE